MHYACNILPIDSQFVQSIYNQYTRTIYIYIYIYIVHVCTYASNINPIYTQHTKNIHQYMFNRQPIYTDIKLIYIKYKAKYTSTISFNIH